MIDLMFDVDLEFYLWWALISSLQSFWEDLVLLWLLASCVCLFVCLTNDLCSVCYRDLGGITVNPPKMGIIWVYIIVLIFCSENHLTMMLSSKHAEKATVLIFDFSCYSNGDSQKSTSTLKMVIWNNWSIKEDESLNIWLKSKNTYKSFFS